MKKHGIIFDCDGTLVDSLEQALHSFNYALNAIGEAPRTIAEIKRYFGTAADRIFFNLLRDETKALSAFEHYLEHQTELAKTTQLHTGIRELLDLLAYEKIPIAIVTGRHSRDLEIVLKPHRLTERFVALVADNQLANSKPAPDGLLLAANKMGLSPSNTIYVGDSVMDIHAAQAAGSIPVAAAWDKLVINEEIAKASPGFMAKTPHEVWPFFKDIFSL